MPHQKALGASAPDTAKYDTALQQQKSKQTRPIRSNIYRGNRAPHSRERSLCPTPSHWKGEAYLRISYTLPNVEENSRTPCGSASSGSARPCGAGRWRTCPSRRCSPQGRCRGSRCHRRSYFSRQQKQGLEDARGGRRQTSSEIQAGGCQVALESLISADTCIILWEYKECLKTNTKKNGFYSSVHRGYQVIGGTGTWLGEGRDGINAVTTVLSVQKLLVGSNFR